MRGIMSVRNLDCCARFARRVFAALPPLFFCAAAAGGVGGRPMLLPADKAPLLFVQAEGAPAFQAEIARTAEETRRGLMFRRIFPKDRAMLFVLGAPRVQAMWMENTPLPLDMVFADEKGKIVHVFEGAKPYSRNLISSVYPASYAVELNAGAVKAAGIAAGQFMRHPAICGACKEQNGREQSKGVTQ